MREASYLHIGQKEQRALDYLRLAHANDPTTWDGVLTNEATSYDGEIEVAYVHWRTAEALRQKGLVTYGEREPDYGTEIVLQRPEIA